MDPDLAERLRCDLLTAFEQTDQPVFLDAMRALGSTSFEREVTQIVDAAYYKAFGQSRNEARCLTLDQSLSETKDLMSRELKTLLGLHTAPGRPTSASHFRVVFMGILIKLDPALSVTAVAKRAFPDDGKLGGILSKRETLERAYRKLKDRASFKFEVELFMGLHARSSLAGRFDSPFAPLFGAMETLRRLGLSVRPRPQGTN